jgi:AcrR family transcriptional regulator
MQIAAPVAPENKKDRTAFERRKQIFNAAVHLFLRKGVSETSMREIADAVGITTGGLYHYVKSKDEIVRMVARNALYAHESVKLLRKILANVSPIEAFRTCATHWLTIKKTGLEQTVFLDRELLHMGREMQKALEDAVRELIQLFEELINDGIKSGDFEVDNVTLVAFNVYMLRTQFATRWWFLKDYFTAEEYAAQQTNAILKQILLDRSKINNGRKTGQ